MRTIHLVAGRQTGKSHWLGHILKEHPNAVMICRDKSGRDEAINQTERDGASLYGWIFTMQDIRTLGVEALIARVGTISHLLVDQGGCERQLSKTFDEVLEPSVIVVRMH